MTDKEDTRIHDVHYNPVNVGEAVGTLFLGILALVLLVALLRAQAHNRKLLDERASARRMAQGE